MYEAEHQRIAGKSGSTQIPRPQVPLQAITERMLTCAVQDFHTSIVKVKSHIGVTGNEILNQLAVAATESWDIDVSDLHTESYEEPI